MREFLEQVVAALKALADASPPLAAMGLGRATVYVNHYPHLVIDDVTFYCHKGRGKTVKIEDTVIKGHDVQAVVSLVLKLLPKKQEEAKKIVEREKMYTTALATNKSLKGSNVSVELCYPDNLYELRLKHTDHATIMAAADYLQDGGFSNPGVPTHKYADEKRRDMLLFEQALSIVSAMTTESKARLLARLTEMASPDNEEEDGSESL